MTINSVRIHFIATLVRIFLTEKAPPIATVNIKINPAEITHNHVPPLLAVVTFHNDSRALSHNVALIAPVQFIFEWIDDLFS